MYICKYCNKRFENKYSKYSNGDFCCKSCARRYSSNIKRDMVNKKIKEYNKTKYENEYYKNPKYCQICGKELTYNLRKRKTCSKDCAKKSRIKNNHYKGGGYREGSGRSKSGWYKGIYCNSTYELAYVIYCLDHNIQIERCNEKFEYEYNGKIHKYYPDFIVNGEIIEIKGIKTEIVDIKLNAVNKPIKILYKDDLIEVFNYVATTYNKKYTDKYNNFFELYDNYKPKYVYECSMCHKKFFSNKKDNKNTHFCSRVCSGKYLINYKNNRKRNIKIKDKNNKMISLKNEERIKIVYNNIDFIDFNHIGWSCRLAQIIGIKNSSVGKWLKKYMSNLYNKYYIPKNNYKDRYEEIDNFIKDNYKKMPVKNIIEILKISKKMFYNRLKNIFNVSMV